MQKYIILALVLVIVIGGFAILNNASTDVNLLFAKINVPLWVLIVATTLMGALLVWILGLGDKFRKRSVINDYKKQVAGLEQRLIDMRKQLETQKPALKETPLESGPAPKYDEPTV